MNMRSKGGYPRALSVLAFVLVITIAGGTYYGHRHRVEMRQRAEAHVSGWLKGPRMMTELLIERYGPPDSLAGDVATWYDRGEWKRISVHGDQPFNFLQQVVGYRPRPETIERVREFDHGIRLDADNEELSATSNHESLNYLTLNMADEIANGRRSPDDARRFFLRTISLSGAGKSSPYMEKLLFEPYGHVSQSRWGKEMGY